MFLNFSHRRKTIYFRIFLWSGKFRNVQKMLEVMPSIVSESGEMPPSSSLFFFRSSDFESELVNDLECAECAVRTSPGDVPSFS